MTQTELNFDKPKIPPIRLMILQAMGDGGWWRLEELAAYCRDVYGKWTSDATISARLRELSATKDELSRTLRQIRAAIVRDASGPLDSHPR